MINWYCLRTRQHYERLVSIRLLPLLGSSNVFCPSERTVKIVKHGKKQETVVGAYSGYTFARWDGIDGGLWHEINNTNDVIEIMGGEYPWPVIPGVVEGWQAKGDEYWVVEGITPPSPRKKLGFAAGDHVRLTYGAFENVSALCDWTDNHGAHLQIKGLLARDQGIYVPFVLGAVLVLDKDWKPQSKTQWRRYHRHKAAMNEKIGDVRQLLA